jgi:hypothetical protein
LHTTTAPVSLQVVWHVGVVVVQLSVVLDWQLMLHERLTCAVQLAEQLVWHCVAQLTVAGVSLHCSVQPQVHAA